MRPLFSSSVTLLAAATALSACTAMGPDYTGPQGLAAAPSQFVYRERSPAGTDTAAPLALWWQALGDAQLNQLMERALQANTDLAIAQARLRQAWAANDLERANRMPTASASAMAGKMQFPEMTLDTQTIAAQWQSLYSLSANASWEADLWGSRTRSVQASTASAESSAATLADAQLSLSAQVAQHYIALRRAQHHLKLSQAALQRQERMHALMQQRYQGGTASRLDVSKLAVQLDTSRAELPAQQADIDASLLSLTALLGLVPGSLNAELAPIGEIPLPPATVAVGDPASLLQRRPDLRAAERTLAARTAQIGVAEAARFPQLKFTGMLGLGGTDLSALGQWSHPMTALLPQLSWNFLEFGRNKARVTQAEALRDEALAQYQGKVLEALKDAETALARFGQRRLAMAHYVRAKASADTAAELTAQRLRSGTVSTLELLDTERQQIQAQQNLLAATAGLTGDYITLQKSLGLGWESTLPARSTELAAPAPGTTAQSKKS